MHDNPHSTHLVQVLNHAPIPLGKTLLPHLPKLPTYLGEHVMKSYYDMIQPPRSPQRSGINKPKTSMTSLSGATGPLRDKPPFQVLRPWAKHIFLVPWSPRHWHNAAWFWLKLFSCTHDAYKGATAIFFRLVLCLRPWDLSHFFKLWSKPLPIIY